MPVPFFPFFHVRYSPNSGRFWTDLSSKHQTVPPSASSDTGRGTTRATTMATIVKRAGHEPWPKLFINCRSTRRTELERVFPNYVVNTWLGHSAKTAEKHYLQVQECDWSNGASKPTVELRGNAGGNTRGNTGSPCRNRGTKKACQNRGNGFHRLRHCCRNYPARTQTNVLFAGV